MLAKSCTKLSFIRPNTRRAASASANISFARSDVSCLAGRRTVGCLLEVFFGSLETDACSDAVGSAVSGLSDRRRQAVVLAFGRALAAIVRLVTCTDESLSVSSLGFADALLLRAGRLSAPCSPCDPSDLILDLSSVQ